MNKILALLAVGMILFGCAQYGGTYNAPNQTGSSNQAGNSNGSAFGGNVISVKISGFAFNPAQVTIKQGDTLMWVNEDSVPHQIGGQGFKSQVLSNGDSYSHTFTEPPGEYPYSCLIHPSMQGKVIVK